ncbi:MAG: NADH-quinone oxidoreductase subunit NuoE [bacterium]|nr:NADH-quinone oxidoreductase subunit NuoE [bacterium]
MFSDEIIREIDDIIARYPVPRSGLIPFLHVIQREQGWISPEAQTWAAERVGISPAEVAGVVTFYTMFNTRPVGRYLLQLCRTISCKLRGSREIRNHLEQALSIKPGETSADGLFTMMEVECLGACGTAPAMMINEDYHENLTTERVDEILAACRRDAGTEVER